MAGSIRVAAPTDADEVRSIYAPFVADSPVSFEEEPPTESEMADRIAETVREYPWLVYGVDDEIVGYAAAGPLGSTPPYDWTVELSVYVDEDARRSGVGAGLYTSLLAVLELQGYYSAYAIVTLPNPASSALHERTGFEPVGTFPAVGYTQGEWHDLRWWYRRLGERPSDPEPPTPLPELRGTRELEAALESGERRLEE